MPAYVTQFRSWERTWFMKLGSIWSRVVGSAWGIAYGLVAPFRSRVVALAVVSFVGAILEAAVLVAITSAVLAITEGAGSVTVLGHDLPVSWALILVGVALLVRLALALIGIRISAGLAARVTTTVRREVADAFLGASWEAQHNEPAGRLQELLTTFVGNATHSVRSFTNWLTAGLSLTAFLVAALVVDVGATAFVLLALVILGAVLYPIRRGIGRRAAVEARTGLNFTNAVSEFGALGFEMQVFGVRDEFVDRVDGLSRENVNAKYRVQTYTEALAPTYMTLAYGGVVIAVAFLAVQGTSGLASVGAVLLLMLRSLAYGQALQGHAGSIASSSAYVRSLNRAIDSYRERPAASGTTQPGSAVPVVFEDVAFSYSAERTTLSGVSLTIESHEIVGVIGPSGAGKSTLAQLILGLREPSSGRVIAGGCDLGEIDREWWSSRVSVVAQDASLFTGTVAENIRFFREGLDDGALHEAAVRANLLDDVVALPEGFGTHLGERGGHLSGGQRQRLSIARALVDGPELLVLDEPTSALDGRSEELIRDSLRGLRGKTTVLIIAHRMSTLDICDRIMVIEDGRVTGFDTPSKLYEQNAFYRNMHKLAGTIPGQQP